MMNYIKKIHHIFQSRAQTDSLHNCGGSSLKTRRRLIKSGGLIGYNVYHISAKLVGRHNIEQICFAIQNAYAAGAIGFVSGKSQKIAINILYIYLMMYRKLACIYQNQGAGRMCNLRYFVNRKNGSQNIGHCRNCHYFGF